MQTFVVIFAVLSVGTFVGLTVGLVIASRLDLCTVGFDEPRKDIAKCLFIAILLGTVGGILNLISGNPKVMAAVLPVWYLAVKLSWLESSSMDIAVLAAFCVASVIILPVVLVRVIN